MTCFQKVIDRLGLNEHQQGELGFLYALCVIADGSGSDVHANAATEAARRLEAAGVGANTMVRVRQMLNSLETAIGGGQ